MKVATILLVGVLCTVKAFSQDVPDRKVPPVVKAAKHKKFPSDSPVLWDMVKGNYRANWGGKSGEDTSAQFTPAGGFIQWARVVPVSSLPSYIPSYVDAHYEGARIRKASRTTDARGRHGYEVRTMGNEMLFDVKGGFIKEEL